MTKYLLIIWTVLLAGCSENEFALKFSTGFKKEDFTVLLEPEGADDHIVYAGGIERAIPGEYGENDWIITYKDSLSGIFRHFKTNRNHTHEYAFFIYKINDSVKCDINIDGVDDLKTTIRLLPLAANPG